MIAGPVASQTDIIERPRLQALFTGESVASPPILLLNAPAGYGKSTYAAQLIEAAEGQNFHIDWVRCSSESTLWQSLRSKLSGSVSPAREKASDFEWVLAYAAELTEPRLLVIDAYQRASDADTDLGLCELSENSPNLRILILARRVHLLDGPLCSARVRSVGHNELGFNATEMRQLSERFGSDVAPEVTAALESTRGWPVAVSAVLAGAANRSERTSRNHTDAYGNGAPSLQTGLTRLATDSLEVLDEEARTILLAASVTDTLSLEHAAEVIGKPASETQQRVYTLLERGLITQTQLTHRKVFRAHPALHSALVATAERRFSATERKEILFGSAREREPHDPYTAFRMFIEAAHYVEAESALAAHFTKITDHHVACSVALAPLPDSVLFAHPTFAAAKLSLGYSDATVSHKRLRHLMRVMHTGAQQRVAEDPATDAATAIAHRVQVMIGERLKGDLPAALSIAQDIESDLMFDMMQGDPTASLNHLIRHAQPAYLSELGFTAYMAGDLALSGRAWGRLDSLMQVPSAPRGLGQASETTSATTRHAAWRQAALNGLTMLAATHGDFTTAARILAEADALREASGDSPPLLTWVNGEVTRAHLAYEETDPVLLRLALDRITPWKDRIEQWPMVLFAEVEASRYLGGPDWAIPHLLDDISHISSDRLGVGVWAGYLTIYRIMLNTTLGNFTASRKLIRTMPPESRFIKIEKARLALFSGDHLDALLQAQRISQSGLDYRQNIDRLLIAAIAAWECAVTDEAFESLRQAGELIKQCNLSMMLRSIPYEPLAALAAAARAAGVCDLTGLVADVPLPVRCVSRENLTEMEQRALDAMVTHPSLVAGAAALFIAPATLKRHRIAIYRKLKVGSREEAILQATRMGLIRSQE